MGNHQSKNSADAGLEERSVNLRNYEEFKNL